jgi:cbb3-type cytochrome oxidase maturation protein
MNLQVTLLTLIIVGSMVLFGLAAVLALAWAVANGQFSNFQRASLSIFDPDEPVGQVTDRFPSSPPPPEPNGTHHEPV